MATLMPTSTSHRNPDRPRFSSLFSPRGNISAAQAQVIGSPGRSQPHHTTKHHHHHTKQGQRPGQEVDTMQTPQQQDSPPQDQQEGQQKHSKRPAKTRYSTGSVLLAAGLGLGFIAGRCYPITADTSSKQQHQQDRRGHSHYNERQKASSRVNARYERERLARDHDRVVERDRQVHREIDTNHRPRPQQVYNTTRNPRLINTGHLGSSIESHGLTKYSDHGAGSIHSRSGTEYRAAAPASPVVDERAMPTVRRDREYQQSGAGLNGLNGLMSNSNMHMHRQNGFWPVASEESNVNGGAGAGQWR
ncbi:hypothetical protein BD289DRAFT_441904 [Coniella lustricola]|uniref:Uncharacterized protein n=1 Tax=Coniella lustricola TaxID=2025994 RepID=A0A2T2ZYV0_9PEZI|nr:hypothetical protein BD289DRAFT_441904 [Coniella lustricola]